MMRNKRTVVRRFGLPGAVVLAALGTAGVATAQSQQGQNSSNDPSQPQRGREALQDMRGQSGQPGQSGSQSGGQPGQMPGRSMSNEQERQQAQRTVQVRESVIYGLSDEPREKLHEAVHRLPEMPEQAAKCVKVAANIMELYASVGESGSVGGQSSAQSGSQSGGQELRQAARQLEQVSDRIRNHELTDMRQTKREFGRALFAMGASLQQAAEQGIARGNEKQLGYTLESAADNLSAALTFSEINADQSVARAIYNAEAAGRQIIALNTPTTYQNNGQVLQTTAEGTTNAQPAGIFDQAQTAGARLDAAGQPNNQQAGQQANQQSTDRASTVASSAQQAVRELGQAVQQLRGQFAQGGSSNQR